MDRTLWKVRYNFDDIIGNSDEIKATIRHAKISAKTDVTVLITGESGTGKEIFAQSIHDGGKRRGKPFVSLNCSAISRELVESELFGYAPGAYTGALSSGALGKFQLAHGGTLFLDEIGEMPLILQAKLLRVISEQEVVRVGGTYPEKIDVRLILATNRDLEKEVEEQNFREDLFYRINTFTITIPPLRFRKPDIPIIADYILEIISKKMELLNIKFSEGFIVALEKYNWPGNVRELQGVIERELLHLEENSIIIKHIPDSILKGKFSKNSEMKLMTIVQMEKNLIKKTISILGDNNRVLSKSLGISQSTLYRKIREYNL